MEDLDYGHKKHKRPKGIVTHAADVTPLSPIPDMMRFIAITNPVHSVYLVAVTQFEQL